MLKRKEKAERRIARSAEKAKAPAGDDSHPSHDPPGQGDPSAEPPGAPDPGGAPSSEG